MKLTNEKLGVRVGKFGAEVYALSKIEKGDFLASFDGRIYTADSDIWKSSYRKYYYDHVIRLGRGRWRAANSIASLFDHSCDPNCEVRLNGDEADMYAIKDIKTSEALTWDYSTTEYGGNWHMKCGCGALKC